MKVVLFDIDGTLMLSGGAGARALTRALGEVFGLTDPLTGVRLNGQTDPQIVLDALERAGKKDAAHPERLDTVTERYLEYLAGEIHHSEKARVLPGVVALLDALAARPDVKLGLVTGNLERGARIKLSRFDLNRYFTCGGYGSDSIQRRELVPIALERASACFSVALSPRDAVVIGDTEKDVDCGRHAGARTLAVATGGVPESVLRDAGPDALFATLEHTERVIETILSL